LEEGSRGKEGVRRSGNWRFCGVRDERMIMTTCEATLSFTYLPTLHMRVRKLEKLGKNGEGKPVTLSDPGGAEELF
jgi:hypothetical protein